jgi:transcriptional regulator with XRE-family HTH domain
MDAATTLRTARELAGLSKRALARRAATSPAAIVAYESGTRDPTIGTLDRLLRATGASGVIELSTGRVRPDPATCGEVLADLLTLVDAIPVRPARRELAFPPFPRRV